MNLSHIDDFFGRHGLVGLDSMVFIYQAQDSPRYGEVCARIFELLAKQPGTGCTSTISLAEVLVLPLRARRFDLVDRYHQLLVVSDVVAVLPVTDSVAEQAAALRALHDLRLADALQLAAAGLAGATGFITNDASYRRVKSVEVLLLQELV